MTLCVAGLLLAVGRLILHGHAHRAGRRRVRIRRECFVCACSGRRGQQLHGRLMTLLPCRMRRCSSRCSSSRRGSTTCPTALWRPSSSPPSSDSSTTPRRGTYISRIKNFKNHNGSPDATPSALIGRGVSYTRRIVSVRAAILRMSLSTRCATQVSLAGQQAGLRTLARGLSRHPLPR